MASLPTAPEGEPARIQALRFATVEARPPFDVAALLSRMSRRVKVPCRLVPMGPGEVPVLADRPEVDADRLLARLEREGREEGTVLIALTARDIASPLFTFFFGRARLHGPAALVSLARLDPAFYGLPPDPELRDRRAVAEILHELGHTLGLSHCKDPACLMHLTTSVEAIDLRGGAFCAACAARLPRGLLVPAG